MSNARLIFPKAVLVGGGLALAGAAAYHWALRPWYERWGATDEEVRAALPGDDLVPHPAFVRTKAVTIQAPVAQVWPWLLQLGQDKAGLYSCEFIENRLLGCEIHNSDRIVPEWQRTQVGDLVRLFPAGKQGPPPYVVASVESNHALVMGHKDETGQWFETWQFLVQPLDPQRTRLIHRVRAGSMGLWDTFQFGYFVMERAMVLGIKERAESLALADDPAPY
jgi:hypothetical protein